MALVGMEWIIDAAECDESALRDRDRLRRLLDRIVKDLDLHPAAPAQWRSFPGPGGVTGLLLLTESHLAVHTFPEHRLATFNLYCCRERPEWPWAGELVRILGAGHVTVRRVARGCAEVGAVLPEHGVSRRER